MPNCDVLCLPSAMESDAKLAMEKLNNSDYGGRKLCLDLAKEKKGPKPLAHQKHPVADEQAAAHVATDATPASVAPVEDDEPSKKHKKAKTPKSHTTEDVADDVDDDATTSKKEKRKAKKLLKHEAAADNQVAESAATIHEEVLEQVADKPANKDKSKKNKKKKRNDNDDEESPKVESVAVPTKKRKLDDQGVQDDSAKKSKANAVAEEEEHVQSERNARRREHRELHRKMKERQEASATTEEKSIAIYGLGSSITEKALKIKMKKVGDATKIEWKEDIVNGVTQQVAIVEWANVSTKAKALEKLDNHVFKGFTMVVRGLEGTTTGLAQKEGVRLIVRNLQFDVKDSDLEKLFGKHGPLAEVRVVRMPVDTTKEVASDDSKVVLGRSRGFGFVQFKNKADAQNSIEALNNTKLKGREIVVDYAVAKSEYIKAQAAQAEPVAVEDEGDNDEGDEDGDNDLVGEDAPELADNENTLEMGDENDEDIDALLDAKEEADNAPTTPKVDTDSQRDRTVFIRNLSFQTSEQGLADAFTSEFGPVEYARVVMDRGSGLSKGVAFVRFRSKDDADAAIARGSVGTPTDDKNHKKKRDTNANGGLFNSAMLDGDGIYVDGRLLSVTRAVAKDDADRLTEENSAKRKAVDKRNMYLAYEGTINVNKAAETELELPKMDIEKRRRAIKEKKEKLKNPLFFISATRLSVRNVALGVDEKVLKTVFREAAIAGLQDQVVNMKEVKAEYQLKKGLPVKIVLCKIVRDTENLKAGEEPRSRGYGFVEFSQHVHALAALRKLNNNPAYTEYSGRGVKPTKGTSDADKTRLIIEFALENHGKLKLREKRMNDAKKRRDEDLMLRKAQGEVIEKVERKSRGKRQREAKASRGNNEPVASDEPASKKSKKDPTKVKGPATTPRKIRPNQPNDKKKPAAAKKGAPAAASRKERKGDRSNKEEKSFEDMVDSYKKKLFSTVEDSESRGRWFE
ncbi:hypothetical protein, variant [Aphanomyces astaci]|uniref:RRM domain-containing protein n=1 Tax=Aphanomyces astaci TaxID=112090 RepID=W4GSM8_APHAT|nr:hypothetical protein, variant [Aphanomyces astaci]ETV82697.1 hypothetical protein, variant [Aphanomyces astaci]|eukprot:XP_009828366.1 hypothetical protein, variant [Aphanomyces astaci]